MVVGEDPETSAMAGQWLVGGRYRLTERLGAGGMGAVWAGRDTLVDREVAVKEAHATEGGPGVERILREARAAARVDHPAVVTVHDVVVEDGHPWIVMERVHGESLAARLERDGALPEREAARIGLEVAQALAAAHARGVLHRDVKPGNVLLGSGGRVVLTDFGIAYIAGEEALTRSGEFVGSLAYTAPERMGGQRPEPASDLWSLGVLLYEMVEGGSPFRRGSMEGTVGAVLTAEVPPLRRAVALAPVITALLAKDPTARPTTRTVTEMLRDVATATVPVRPSSAARSRRRVWWAAALFGAAALAVVTPPAVDRFGDGPASGPSPSASPAPRTSPKPSPTATSGYERVREAEFELEVPAGWRHHGENAHAQYIYTSGEYELIVVPGRDAVADYTDDLMTYQREMEMELQPYRDTEWGTASGLRTLEVDGHTSAEGQFTWQHGEVLQRYVRNRVMNIDGRIHVLVASGPEAERDAVSRLYDHVVKTYTPRS